MATFALTGDALPSGGLRGIVLNVDVAGRRISRSFAPVTNLTYDFLWDGLDAYGRPVHGPQKVRYAIIYVYGGGEYFEPQSGEWQSFGKPPSQVMVGSPYNNVFKSQAGAFVMGEWMAAGMGLGALANVIHPYPTQAEVIRKAGDAYNRTRLTPFVQKLFRGWLALTR